PGAASMSVTVTVRRFAGPVGGVDQKRESKVVVQTVLPAASIAKISFPPLQATTAPPSPEGTRRAVPLYWSGRVQIMAPFASNRVRLGGSPSSVIHAPPPL